MSRLYRLSSNLDVLVLLEVVDNDLDSSRDVNLVRLDVKFGVLGSLVRSRDTGEVCRDASKRRERPRVSNV